MMQYIPPSLSKWFQSIRARITLISISPQPCQSLALIALDLIRPLKSITFRVPFPSRSPDRLCPNPTDHEKRGTLLMILVIVFFDKVPVTKTVPARGGNDQLTSSQSCS